MAELGAIRSALKTRLEAIGGVRAHDIWPDQVNPPAGMLAPISGDYDDDMSGDSTHRLELVFVIQWGTTRGAQNSLDPYIATTGSKSVKAALEQTATGQDVLDSVKVSGYRDYGRIDLGGGRYLGCVFDVEVMA